MNLYNLYNSINESQEIDEQGLKKATTQALKSGVSDDIVSALVSVFKVDAAVVKKVMSTDKKKLESGLKRAINKDIKSNIIGGGQTLGPNAKLASKELAMKEILDLGKAVNRQEMVRIIEKNKNNAKQMASRIETQVTKTTNQQTTQTGTKQKPPVTGPNTVKTLTQRLKGLLSNNILGKINKLRKKFKLKWLVFFGLIGATVLTIDQIRKYLEDSKLDELDMMEAFAKCILILIDTIGAELGTVNGDPVVIVKKTGNPDYDNKGGLIFYPNNIVITGDNSQKGKWECNPDEGQVQVNEGLKLMMLVEQESNVVDTKTMDKQVKIVRRSLSGWVSVNDLKKLKEVIVYLQDKVYKDESAIKQLNSYYEYFENSKIIDDVKSVGVRNLGIEGVDLKKEITQLLNQPISRVVPSNALSGVKITWGGQEQPTTNDTSSGQQSSNEPEYVNCETTGFPYKYGCVSSHIAKIQRCLGIHPQKGYFGPKTLRVLRNIGHDMSSGLTQEIYDIEVRRCEGTPKTQEPQQEPETPSTQAQFNSRESSFTNDRDLDDSFEFYNMLSSNGLIVIDKNNTNRIKFKGAELTERQLSMLDTVLKLRGFYRLKNVEKDYGYKHVWQKRKRQ